MNKSDITQLYEQYHVPVNIQAHMRKVAMVTAFLCNGINTPHGKNVVNANQAVAAALLHDLMKMIDVKNPHENVEFWKKIKGQFPGIGHEEAGAIILEQLGKAVIADIIRKSGYSSIIDTKLEPRTLEEKIVYYADKRVMHDNIVSLKERLKDGRKRYKHNAILHDRRAEQKLYTLERELCDLANITASDITEQHVPVVLDQYLNGRPPRY